MKTSFIWLWFLLYNFFHIYYIQILEKEMATHSSILVWKIPWMEEPGGLQSMGSQRVGHDWKTTIPYSVFIIFFLELRFLNWKMRIITSTLSTAQRYFKKERQKACKIALRITKHYVKPLSTLRWRVSMTMYNYIKNERKGKWYWLNWSVVWTGGSLLTPSISHIHACFLGLPQTAPG